MSDQSQKLRASLQSFTNGPVNKKHAENEHSKAKKLTVSDTALALVAGTIGGEMVAIPYAVHHMGLFLSIGTIIVVAIISHISNMMYLKVKDLTPCKHESIYEIAYLLLGRPAIFTVCIVQYLLNFSSMVLYYIIIGDTIGNIFSHFFVNKDALTTRGEAQQDLKSESVWTQIVSHRSFWILTVGAVLLSIIFMRQLRELKVISYIFMMIMLLFLGLLSLEL